jgi:hypothetical protein
VLEITSIVDALHLKQSLDADHLKVRFVPRRRSGRCTKSPLARSASIAKAHNVRLAAAR